MYFAGSAAKPCYILSRTEEGVGLICPRCFAGSAGKPWLDPVNEHFNNAEDLAAAEETSCLAAARFPSIDFSVHVCVCNFEKIQMTASDHVQAAAPLRFADFGDGTRPWSIQTFSTLCGLGQCGTVLAPCCWTWRSTVPSVLIPIFPPGTSAFRPGSLNACMHMCICKYVFWHAQGLGAGCARLVPSAWLVAILG